MRGIRIVTNQVTLASLVILILVFAGWAVNYLLMVSAVRTSEHKWCLTLSRVENRAPDFGNSVGIPGLLKAYGCTSAAIHDTIHSGTEVSKLCHTR